MSILVVGTVAFDAIETPYGKTEKIVGGAATYICIAASFFSKKINLVSVVGDDFPSKTIRLLNNKSVDTEGLQIKEGRKTFFWSGKYHNNMNSRDTLETQLNVLEDFEPKVPKKHTTSCVYNESKAVIPVKSFSCNILIIIRFVSVNKCIR